MLDAVVGLGGGVDYASATAAQPAQNRDFHEDDCDTSPTTGEGGPGAASARQTEEVAPRYRGGNESPVTKVEGSLKTPVDTKGPPVRRRRASIAKLLTEGATLGAQSAGHGTTMSARRLGDDSNAETTA